MKLETPVFDTPTDAAERKAILPVICYPPDSLPPLDLDALQALRDASEKSAAVTAAPRDAVCCDVPAGAFFRISSVEGHKSGV